MAALGSGEAARVTASVDAMDAGIGGNTEVISRGLSGRSQPFGWMNGGRSVFITQEELCQGQTLRGCE